MRELPRWRGRMAVMVTVLAAGTATASVARASHDAACQALPASAQRGGTRACNPRQECFSATPGNPACNAAPTSGTCATTETYSPGQECLAKLPPTPAVSVSSVDRGAAGANHVYAGRPDVLRVRGPNVGMAGNTVAAETGLAVGLVAAP